MSVGEWGCVFWLLVLARHWSLWLWARSEPFLYQRKLYRSTESSGKMQCGRQKLFVHILARRLERRWGLGFLLFCGCLLQRLWKGFSEHPVVAHQSAGWSWATGLPSFSSGPLALRSRGCPGQGTRTLQHKAVTEDLSVLPKWPAVTLALQLPHRTISN